MTNSLSVFTDEDLDTLMTAILRSEVGVWSIENQLICKKLTYLQRLVKQENTMTKLVLEEQDKLPGPTWKKEIDKQMISLDIMIPYDEIKELSKYKWKKILRSAITKKEIIDLQRVKITAKKGKNLPLDNISLKKYLSVLDIEEALIILKLRTGMLDVKSNFSSKYQDLRCPMCMIQIDTTMDPYAAHTIQLRQ